MEYSDLGMSSKAKYVSGLKTERNRCSNAEVWAL